MRHKKEHTYINVNIFVPNSEEPVSPASDLSATPDDTTNTIV
jgi:hypothetical protein